MLYAMFGSGGMNVLDEPAIFAPFENRKIAMSNGSSPEETKRRRDMRRVVWILLPVTAFFFLLLVIQRFGLSR
jgi:hypothetical protein